MYSKSCHAHCSEREADEDRRRQHQQRPPRRDETHQQHHDEERAGVERATQQCPPNLAGRDVHRCHRGRQDRVVELVVLQLEEDVERRVIERAVHGARGQHRRCDEGGIADQLAAGQLDVADQPGDPDSDGQKVEQRFEDAGEQHDPARAIDACVALDEEPRMAAAEEASRGRGRYDPPRKGLGRHHFSNRRRKLRNAIA
jgi:hypothetical protein